MSPQGQRGVIWLRVCGSLHIPKGTDFIGFYLVPLNRITCQMLFSSNSSTLLGTCKLNLLLDFPTVVSSVLLYSGQDVVSFSEGHLAQLGAAGSVLESVKMYQCSSTVIGFRLLQCQGWVGLEMLFLGIAGDLMLRSVRSALQKASSSTLLRAGKPGSACAFTGGTPRKPMLNRPVFVWC